MRVFRVLSAREFPHPSKRWNVESVEGGMRIPIRGGLDISLPGAPRQIIGECAEVSSVALLGADFPGVRPA